MRVALLSYLLHSRGGYRSAGVSTYIRHLLTHLPEVHPEHTYLAFHGRDGVAPRGVESVLSPLPTENPAVRILWEQTGFPAQAACLRPDVVHATVNVSPWLCTRPTVVTVHDLAFLRHPERFRRGRALYLRGIVGESARRAEIVIAASESTKRDLVDLCRVSPDRVEVIYQGVDERFTVLADETVARFRKRELGDRPYILHVGTLEPRKNIDILVRAFAGVRQQAKIPHVLALVGARGWMYESLFALVNELGLENDVRFVEYVEPSQLPLWYNGADIFAYPSAYEGFGLPVIEAMACGVPAITSSSSSLVEIAGDAALIVDTGSVESLHMAISRILEDRELRCRLRRDGLARAGTFSWTTTASRTVSVYEAIAGSRQG